MKNYIMVNGKQIPLTEEQIREIVGAYEQKQLRLSDVSEGEMFKISDREFIVLGHFEDETAVISKDILETMPFGNSNNFNESAVDDFCESLAEDIANTVGKRNLVLHTVNLTSDDGMNDYGRIQRRISLLTADQYRTYVDILDKHKPDVWWLATPFSTARHENDLWVKCVSPSGSSFLDHLCNNDNNGVRPFLILKSSIFESSEE